MTDPNRYIRDAVIDALRTGGYNAYGQNPPASAVTPYAIVSVSYEQRPVKLVKFYTVTIAIDLYHEFREAGGRKQLDEMTDFIFTTLIPNNNTYLSVSGFQHVNCRLASSNESMVTNESITTYIKNLRFTSLITE